MKAADLAREALQTALRLLPWPTEPGLRRVGEPGPLSPVIVTGNYDLTVRRVARALAGSDAWLVVAPSSGINVWCAAAGGMLTTHQVVTALKSSGVADVVRHRRVILPQLAATGVRAREVSRRCGWRVHFGPVYARDLPRYLAAEGRKSDDMRHVRFGVVERFEMAVSWAAPSACVVGGLAAWLRPAWWLPLTALALALPVACFLALDRLPEPRRLLFAAAAAALSAASVVFAGGSAAAASVGGGAAVLLTGLLTFDYPGSTPIEGGSHFDDRHFQIVLDPERCRGVFSCWEACPEAVFEKPLREGAPRVIALAHPEQCIRCGACVVQCPQDALAFEAPDGRRVEPDVIRRFKLNLLGRRAVDAEASSPRT